MRTFSKALLLGLLLLMLGGCGKKETGLTVVFPKLGSADGALLMTEDATVLIDTGEDGDGDTLLSLLNEYDRTSVDLLIISHYDKDHVGGADQIIRNVTVKRVIGSTSPKESEDYEEYLEALSEIGLSEEIPTEETELAFGDLKLTIDPPQQETYQKEQSNNSSLVVSAEYEETHVLFTGDAMEERLAEFVPELIERGMVYDVVKLPHHGREIENAEDLLRAVGDSGTLSVITSSKKEPEADGIVDALPGTVRLTREGGITAFSDGKQVTVTQE